VSNFAALRLPALSHCDRKTVRKSIPLAEEPSPATLTDEALIMHICSCRKDALRELFERYARLLRSICRRILRDDAEAEDLVHDVFLYVEAKSSVFDNSKSSARSWIIQMAYQRAIERRRYLTTRQFYAHTEATDSAEQVVGNPTTEQDYSVEVVFGRIGLSKVLETLSADQRETLRLYFFEGYTLTEISQKLGQPRGNVRHHYYRAIDKLRKHMFGSKVQVVEGHGR
jgi:RNA polymerase sigma-70 factor, ECF subfamily